MVLGADCAVAAAHTKSQSKLDGAVDKLFLEVFVSAQLVIGLKMAWDQEFSSGLMLLTIMIVRLFQFRSAVTVAPKLVVRFDILQDPCTWRSP